MSPALQAAQVYIDEPCSHTFGDALGYYLENGFVFSTPDYFVMGRPVSTQWRKSVIVDPVNNEVCNNELTLCLDAWHIALMAGNVSKVWEVLPYELPLISIERSNKLKFYDHERFRRMLLRGGE